MLDSERTSYLKALIYIAASDEDFDEREMEFFIEAGLSCGLSHSEVLSIKDSVTRKEESLEDILRDITVEDTKTELLCDLLTLCYLDGSYSILEQVGMRAICDILGIAEERLEELETLAEESFKKEKNPFQLFKKSRIGGNMLSGLKKAFEASKEGSKVFGSKVKKGGSSVARSVSKGVGIVGTKISGSVESVKKQKEENRILREKLKKETISEAVKQRVISQLHGKITTLSAQLKAEKERNHKNEEMIRLLQAQIDDLEETMSVAENARVS